MPQNYKNQPSINRFNFCRWYEDQNRISNGELEIGSGNNFTNWSKTIPTHTNMVAYSSEFDNVYWTKVNTAIVPNATNNPFGTLNADKFYPTSIGTDRRLNRVLTTVIGNYYVTSIYAKKGEKNYIGIYNVNINRYAAFNLNTGTIDYQGTDIITGIEAVPNSSGWYRVWVAGIATSTTGYSYIISLDNTSSVTSVSGTDGIFIYGLQTELGTTPTSLINTTTTSLTVDDGEIIPATRTNLWTYSEDISHSSYFYQRASYIVNSTVSPFGEMVVDELISQFDPLPVAHRFYKPLGSLNGKYNLSLYAKKNTAKFLGIGINSNGVKGANNIVVFNLDTGLIVSNQYSIDATITLVPNTDGWYRISINYDLTGSTLNDVCIHNLSNGSFTASTFQAFNTEATPTSIYLFGFQFEQNAIFPSAYIKTTSSFVTVNDGLNASRAVRLNRGVTPTLAFNHASAFSAIGKYKVSFWAKTASASTTLRLASDVSTFTEFSITNREYIKYEFEVTTVSGDSQLRFFNMLANSSLIIDNVRVDFIQEGNSNNIPNPYTFDNDMKYTPLLVNGDKFRFYINADTPLTGLTFANLRLALFNSDNVRMYSDANINSLAVGAGIHIYSNDNTLNISSYPDGLYYWAIIDINTGTTKYTSNYFRIVSSGYNDYSTTIEYSHYKSMYNYRYSNVAFSNKFRVHILLSDVVYGGENSEYQEISTGFVRKTSALKQRIYKVETYYFDSEAHEAMQIMCEHNTVNINGKAYLAKGVYSPNIEQVSNVSKGEAEFIDQEYSQLNN